MKAHENFLAWEELEPALKKLDIALKTDDRALINDIIKGLVQGYTPEN